MYPDDLLVCQCSLPEVVDLDYTNIYLYCIVYVTNLNKVLQVRVTTPGNIASHALTTHVPNIDDVTSFRQGQWRSSEVPLEYQTDVISIG